MNAEELATRLRMLCQFFRFNVECAGGVTLLHGNINAANPCVVHTNVRDDVSAFVSHCDVHGLANFPSFLLRRADYAAGIFQFHCGHGFSLFMRYATAQIVELAEQIAVRTYFVSPLVRLPAFAAAFSIKSATSFG